MPTPTDRNRFRKPDPGSDNNTWGVNLNQAMFDLIDDSLDGVVEISASGATTLTNTQYIENQARMRMIKYLALASGTITVPNVEKWYIVYAPSADVVISAGSLVTATVKAGDTTIVFCDGSDVRRVQTNNFLGSEIKGLATPTTNTSATTKAYVDGLAFAAGGALPGINSGTLDQYVTNDGTTAYWNDVLPTRSAVTLNQTLKSLGTNNGSVASTVWDWDGYQGTVDKSANYTVVLDDRSKWINCTAALTLALTAAGTLGSKFIIRVINATANSNVTVDPNGAELINGAATLTILPGETWDIASTGSAFSATPVVQTPSGWDVIVQDQRVAGTNRGLFGSGFSYKTLPLNTLTRSTVTGASIVSNQLTLPAGTWLIKGRTVNTTPNVCRLSVYNVTDSVYEVLGPVGNTVPELNCEGYITASSPKTYELQQLTNGTLADISAVNFSSQPEVYAQLFVKRVAP